MYENPTSSRIRTIDPQCSKEKFSFTLPTSPPLRCLSHWQNQITVQRLFQQKVYPWPVFAHIGRAPDNFVFKFKWSYIRGTVRAPYGAHQVIGRCFMSRTGNGPEATCNIRSTYITYMHIPGSTIRENIYFISHRIPCGFVVESLHVKSVFSSNI